MVTRSLISEVRTRAPQSQDVLPAASNGSLKCLISHAYCQCLGQTSGYRADALAPDAVLKMMNTPQDTTGYTHTDTWPQ